MALTLLNGITYAHNGFFFIYEKITPFFSFHKEFQKEDRTTTILSYKEKNNNYDNKNNDEWSSDSDNDHDIEEKNNDNNEIKIIPKVCKMDIEENITIENKQKKSKKKWKNNLFRYIMFLNFFSFGAYLVYSFNPFFALKFWMNPYDYAFLLHYGKYVCHW